MESKTQAVPQYNHVPSAPDDPILSLIVTFLEDKFPEKVMLGVGAYRTEEGEPYVFECVREAEQRIINDKSLKKEYLPIDGNKEFLRGARGVLFGFDHPMVDDERVVSAQTLSGSGALRLIGDFLAKFRPSAIYMSTPTWGNHPAVMETVGIEARQYRYFDKETRGLNFDGMIEDLKNAQPGSIVLLHTCAHNPTGVDPTFEQWKQIAEVCRDQHLYPWFDTAYQGFVSGNLDKDGAGIRYFVDQGFEMIVAQSFSKILGLYGERTGAMHVITSSKQVAINVRSQIKLAIRCNWSSPPMHGARIAAICFNDPEMRASWLKELVNVTDRITAMRELLRSKLEEIETPGTWNHVTDQIGMFSFTGLTVAQSKAMVEKHHVYMTPNGRISVAGLTTKNADYVAKAIKDVVENY